MLTENQRRAFRRNGFLALPHFARAKEVAEIRAILETLFARQAGLEQGHLIDFAAPSFDPAQPRMPQLLYPLDHAPALRATALHDRVHALAREMLGPMRSSPSTTRSSSRRMTAARHPGTRTSPSTTPGTGTST